MITSLLTAGDPVSWPIRSAESQCWTAGLRLSHADCKSYYIQSNHLDFVSWMLTAVLRHVVKRIICIDIPGHPCKFQAIFIQHECQPDCQPWGDPWASRVFIVYVDIFNLWLCVADSETTTSGDDPIQTKRPTAPQRRTRHLRRPTAPHAAYCRAPQPANPHHGRVTR